MNPGESDIKAGGEFLLPAQCLLKNLNLNALRWGRQAPLLLVVLPLLLYVLTSSAGS